MSNPIENSRRYLQKLTFSPLRVRGEGERRSGNAMARLSMFASVAFFWSVEELNEAIGVVGDGEIANFLTKYRDIFAGAEADKSRPLRRLLASASDDLLALAITAVIDAEREKLDASRARLTALEGPPVFRIRAKKRDQFGRTGEFGDDNKVVFWLPGLPAEVPPDPNAAEKAALRTTIQELEGKTGRANQVVRELKESKPAEPLGLLFLERVALTPCEPERGELVYSLPLAPKEKVTLSHKEWRIRQEEFTQAVQDFIERYSERGVTSATELSASTTDVTSRTDATRTSNTKRAGNTSREGASNVTTTEQIDAVNVDNVTQHETSRNTSVTESKIATELASSRSIQDHKVSFTVTTVAGAEDFTSRVLENPAPDQTMRIDYWRRMQRWKVALERVDVRLTYSVVVPDPGFQLRQPHLELQRIETTLSQGFVFDLNPGSITAANMASLSSSYGVALPPPPAGLAPGQWQAQVWEILRSASWARFTAAQEAARARRDQLLRMVGGTDVLRLRRLEQEQLTYQVMKWLFPRLNDEWKYWEDSNLYSMEWENVLEYGDYIHFVHDAVDWDNMLVSLYPHFWDANSEAQGKPFLNHPDPEHREFLRAGAARVVLPIRPGYEMKVLALLEYGEIGDLEEGHGFRRIIDQVAAEHKARKDGPETLGEWEECTPTGALDLDVVVRKVLEG